MTSGPSEPGRPSLVASVLWAHVCLFMWLWAVVGPLCLAAGVVSFFVDRDGRFMPPSEAVWLGGVLAGVALPFVWLRARRYIRFAESRPGQTG